MKPNCECVGLIKPETFDEFFYCQNCQLVYWKGTHNERIVLYSKVQYMIMKSMGLRL
ncbi:Mut7-C RNAse domain-containing protein [Saccharicrinis sp. FJH2]|uniref:Mut7-C RNAse domain-containing protein n=1 Tax=Saccharicrinis sp. FJH65 TaxID=3344659 RepID=UPI0035F373BF